ncbi:hypothetical protein LINPERPRIM_LOCUS11522 [Linum perenne]
MNNISSISLQQIHKPINANSEVIVVFQETRVVQDPQINPPPTNPSIPLRPSPSALLSSHVKLLLHHFLSYYDAVDLTAIVSRTRFLDLNPYNNNQQHYRATQGCLVSDPSRSSSFLADLFNGGGGSSDSIGFDDFLYLREVEVDDGRVDQIVVGIERQSCSNDSHHKLAPTGLRRQDEKEAAECSAARI